MGIKDHVREKLEDKEFTGEVRDPLFERKDLVRVFAVGVLFEGRSTGAKLNTDAVTDPTITIG